MREDRYGKKTTRIILRTPGKPTDEVIVERRRELPGGPWNSEDPRNPRYVPPRRRL